MRKYNCVLFDLDGTLSDPREGIFRCFRLGLRSVGLDEPDDERLRAVIGPPLYDSYTRLYGLTPEQAQTAIAAYRADYAVLGYRQNRLYEGVFPMLRALHQAGLFVMMATSKPEAPTMDIIRHFGIAPYFDFVAAASMDHSRSEKSKVIEYALQNAPGISKEQMVMVGDRQYDLLGAQAHGLDGIGVLYGYGSYEELSACPHVFLASAPQELCSFLLEHKLSTKRP